MSNLTAFAWHGLPLYGAFLLRTAIGRIHGPCQVLSTESKYNSHAVENALGMDVKIVHAERKSTWDALGLPVPKVFFYTGWSTPAFNSLCNQVKAARGRTVCMVDNCKKDTFRQALGRIAFIRYRGAADAFLVCGSSGRSLMQYLGVNNERVHEGLYAADSTIFVPGAPLLLRPKRFLFVGQFTARKDPLRLLRAFQDSGLRCRGWSMKFIGDGPLRSQLQARGAQVDRFLEPAAVAEAMRRSRFLALPSLEEHWGMVVHEAACSGCGLILSDRVGARSDLLNDKNGFLTRVGDTQSLTVALRAAASLSEPQLEETYETSLKLAAAFTPERFAAVVADLAETVPSA